MKTNQTDNVVFKIFGKNGELIEQSSILPGEAEVLFKSKTAFTVESVKPIQHPLHPQKEIFEIILKEK